MDSGAVTRIESLADPGPAAMLLAGSPTHVVLLANNPRIAPAALDRLPLGPDCLLVQFNRPRFDGALRGRPCRRAYVFTNHQDRFFGFDAAGRAEDPLLASSDPPPVLVFCGRTLAHVGGFIAALPPAVGVLQVPEKRWLLPDYPRGRGPSTGFVALRLLQALNQQRRAAGQVAVPLELVGFTGFRRGAVALHDWWYEQRWLRRQPDLRLNSAGALEGGWRLRALGWCLSHWRSRLRGWVAAMQGKA